LPIPSGTVADGSSDEQPLRLEGVKQKDFVQLLRVMFPRFVEFLIDDEVTDFLTAAIFSSQRPSRSHSGLPYSGYAHCGR
jgi:hypothetical protein